MSVKKPASKVDIKEQEKQIDQMVYKLYALTLEETAVVEGSQKS